ncbi:MAG TPA: DUF2231 domain-containing protein [Chitinophagaceae bacterium]|jgi:uncharacterized membrane protein/nitrite reductase/ring-hydroxylating ferredoxin subunit|nr:DUF2231 domain-containing protein [Chitinophagaceae bacterium]
MKSKAHFKGHPLHPILVSFPIAFFIGTLIFDVIGLVYDRNDFYTTAMYLEIAGIGFALLAAIPGIIDYFFVIPPKSSAKKRGATHGLINITMVIIFSVALLLRQKGDLSFMIIIGLEIAGVILLSIAGWLGGTLVFRNQIGVDIRYADAGKWKEEYLDNAHGEINVASIDELQVNQMKLIHIKGKRIVVCRTEKGYAAFDDHCTHRGGSLAGGAMICGTVQCPWHGSQFDVNSGSVLAGPAKESISVYAVKETDKLVYLILS